MSRPLLAPLARALPLGAVVWVCATWLAPAPAAADAYVDLTIRVHDGELETLRAPGVVLVESGLDPIPLADGGVRPDEQRADHIWTAQLRLLSAPTFTVVLLEAGASDELCRRELAIPMATEASLDLYRVAGDPCLLQTNEFEQFTLSRTSGVESASDAGPSGDGGGGRRFAAVLWLFAILALVAFGYLRVVLRSFAREFLPTWQKLGRWLDRQEAEVGEDSEEFEGLGARGRRP